MTRFLLALALSVLAIASLAACNGGVDSDNDSLPNPAIFAASAPEACSSSGATTIVLDPLSALVTVNAPISSPLGRNQLQFSGTVTGLGANTAYALVVDGDFACPVYASAPLALAGDGDFSTVVRISDSTGDLLRDLRVVVIAGPAGGAVGCPIDSDCLQLGVGGASVGITGISNAIGVRP